MREKKNATELQDQIVSMQAEFKEKVSCSCWVLLVTRLSALAITGSEAETRDGDFDTEILQIQSPVSRLLVGKAFRLPVLRIYGNPYHFPTDFATCQVPVSCFGSVSAASPNSRNHEPSSKPVYAAVSTLRIKQCKRSSEARSTCIRR